MTHPGRPRGGGRGGVGERGAARIPRRPRGRGEEVGVRAPSPCPKCWGAPPERFSLPDGESPALGGERGQREIALPALLVGLSLGMRRAQVSAPLAVPRAGPQTAPKDSPAKARAFRGAGRTAPLGSYTCPGALPCVTRPSVGRQPPTSAEVSPRVHPCTSVRTTWTLPLRRAAALGFCTPQSTFPERFLLTRLPLLPAGFCKRAQLPLSQRDFSQASPYVYGSARAEGAPAAAPVLHGSRVVLH